MKADKFTQLLLNQTPTYDRVIRQLDAERSKGIYPKSRKRKKKALRKHED